MSLKINFFPLHFIISILLLITMVIVFSDTVYIYMSSNIYINGLIIGLFILCMLWVLGVLSYYSRSMKIINRLFSSVAPSSGGGSKGQAMYIASSIAGTLIDNPITSKVLSTFSKTGKLDVSYSDAIIIVDSVAENGDRVLGPSKFLASVFTMLGLFGTFVGLLQTIDGVGTALKSLSDADNVDIFGLVGLLADPLQGMSVAFSTSLFGLVAALFANYGNYVAAQQLSVFVNKLRNFLTATTGVANLDPAEIKAEDILLALEDSFNKLSMTFSEKLDIVSEGLFAMSKIIARGQDRQEKLTKAMLLNLVKLLELADKLNILDDLANDISQVLEENRIELFKYLDESVVSNLTSILDSLDLSNRISSDGVEISEKTAVMLEDLSSTVDDILDVNQRSNAIIEEVADDINESIKDNGVLLEDILSASEDMIEVVESIDDKTTGIDYRPDFDEIVDKLSENNNLALESNDLSDKLNDLSDESNNLVDKLINTVATEDSLGSAVEVLDDTLGELEEHKGLLNDTLDELEEHKGLLNDTLGELEEHKGLLNDTLDELEEHKGLLNDTLDELGEHKVVLDDTLSSLNDFSSLANDNLYRLIEVSEDMFAELADANPIYRDMLQTLNDTSDTAVSLLQVTEDSLVVEGEIRDSIYDFREGLLAELEVSNSYLSSIKEDSERLSMNSDSVVDYLSNVSDVLVNLDRMFIDFSANIIDYLPVISDSIMSVSDELSRIAGNVINLSDNVYSLADNLATHSESIDVFGSIVGNLDYRMEALDLSTSSLNSSIQEMTPALYENIDISNRNAEYLSQLIGTLDYIAQMAENIDKAVNAFAEAVLQENAYIAEQVSIVSSTVMESTNRITNSLDNTSYAMMSVSDQVANVVDKSIEVAESNMRAAETMVSIVSDFSSLRDIYSYQMTELSELLSESISTVLNTFDYISNNMVDLSGLIAQVELYSNEAMNTQQVIKEVVSEMLQVQEAMSYSQSGFLESLTEQVGYTTNMLISGVDSVIDKLENINMLTEVQTGKLDALDYRLSELPNTVAILMSELGGLFSNTHDMIYDMMSQSSQTQSSIMEVLNDSQVANNMVKDMVASNLEVQAVVESLADQSSYANNIVMDLSSQTSAIQSSVMELSNAFQGVYSSMSNTASELAGASNSLFSIVGELSMQTEALNRNSEISTNLSSDLQSLAFSNESLREVSGRLGVVVDSFMSLSNTLSRIESSTNSMEDSFSSYADSLTSQLSFLTQTLNSHLEAFMSKDLTLGQQTFELLNNVLSAVNDISNAINTFESFASDSINANLSVRSEIQTSMDYAVSEIASIKENLGNNISERIMYEISQVSNNQGQLISRLDAIMPQVDGLINYLYSNGGGSGGQNTDLLNALLALREEQVNGNARLDIMASAVDALITEILNSRDVAEAILEVVRRMSAR